MNKLTAMILGATVLSSVEVVYAQGDSAQQDAAQASAPQYTTSTTPAPQSSASQAAIQEDAALVDQASQPDATVDPTELVEKAIADFYETSMGRQLKAKSERGALYLGEGIAQVEVPPSDPQWVKYRAMAYEQALVDAMSNYLLAMGQKLRTEETSKFFNDGSGHIPDWQESNLERSKLYQLLDKAVAVADATLDKKLESLGIDPQKFKSASPEQRHKLFEQALTIKTMRKAVSGLAGMLPVQTFEGRNKDGEHVIGVLIVVSDKMKQLADSIRRNGDRIQPDLSHPGKPIAQRLNAVRDQLVDQFGLRVWRDEQGYPVLVSFGQWGINNKGLNSRMAFHESRAAESQARALADKQIAMFIAGKGVFDSKQEVGQLVETVAKVTPDNFKSKETTQQIVDKVMQTLRARANVTLTGLSDALRWQQAYPSYPQQKIVGVVRTWNPRLSQKLRKLRDGHPEPVKIHGTTGVRQSNMGMDINDF